MSRFSPLPLTLFMLAACGGGGDGSSGPKDDATLSGTVRAAGVALPGAIISVGTHKDTSDATGHFELTGLPTGSTTAQAARPGYISLQAALSLSTGTNNHDFLLDPQEIYTSGAYSMLVPTGVATIRGVVISLGGGVTTSGFVTGGPLEPNNIVLEQSLQLMGASLRAMVKSSHVALLGTTIHSLANSAASDNSLFAAMVEFANLSGHPELANAPVLMFGLGAGTSPEGSGLASRVPQRVIGVLERVPVSVPILTTPETLAVPTFVMLSELDEVVDNSSVQATFAGNRSRGGLWALAVEPGIVHAGATVLANGANVGWIAAALAARLPTTPGDPLVALDEQSGWLGDQATFEIASWANYTGDPTTASWLLSQTVANTWKTLVTSSGGPGGVNKR